MRRYQKEGPGLPAPKVGLPGFLYILKNNIWTMFGANLLFSLFSLGIITIPAAFCALNRVLVLLIRNGHCFLWQDFVQEFRRSFKRSLLPGLLFLLIFAVAYYFGSLGLTNAAILLSSMLFWAVCIVLLVAGLAWGAYSFVFIALLDLNNRDALKNARLLCMAKPFLALVVSVVIIASLFISAALMPVWIFAIPIFGVVIPQYVVCWLVYDVANEYILIPYERMKAEEEKAQEETSQDET